MNALIDISCVTLKTQRLILRPWRETDLEDFYEYAKVDGVGQMAGWLPHESKETTQMILDSFITHKKTFALERNGKVIGSLGIENYKEDEFPEFAQLRGRSIGYVLSKDYWGQGLMPEAVQAVINYAFNTGIASDIYSRILSMYTCYFRMSSGVRIVSIVRTSC